MQGYGSGCTLVLGTYRQQCRRGCCPESPSCYASQRTAATCAAGDAESAACAHHTVAGSAHRRPCGCANQSCIVNLGGSTIGPLGMCPLLLPGSTHLPLVAATKPALEQETSCTACSVLPSAWGKGVTHTSSPVSTWHHLTKPSAPPSTRSVPLLLKLVAVIPAEPAAWISFFSANDGGGSNRSTLLLVLTASCPLLDSAMDDTGAPAVADHVFFSSGSHDGSLLEAAMTVLHESTGCGKCIGHERLGSLIGCDGHSTC